MISTQGRHEDGRHEDLADLQTRVLAGKYRENLEEGFNSGIATPVAIGSILPFEDTNIAKVLPANTEVLLRHIPGYVQPTVERVQELAVYAKAPENYGTAPAESAAFIEAVVLALKPRNAFVFGTGRGRLEQIICEACDRTVVGTVDLPQELLGVTEGSPDGNNIRYRTKIGITSNEDIGSIFKSDPNLKDRVHQVLTDSYNTSFVDLHGLVDLVVIDANHAFDNAFFDLCTAYSMISDKGGVILIDDFRKPTCMNSSVEAAGILFSHITGLPIVQPMPGMDPEKQPGLAAPMGMIIVPEGERLSNQYLNAAIQLLKYSL